MKKEKEIEKGAVHFRIIYIVNGIENEVILGAVL